MSCHRNIAASWLFSGLLACALAAQSTAPATRAPQAPPRVADARTFLDHVEATLLKLSTDAGRAGWVQATYITHDTELLASQASQALIDTAVRFAKESRRFDGLALPEDLDRKMKLLKVALTLATPAEPKESEELTRLVTGMESLYGKGKYCPAAPPKGDENNDKCVDLQEITKIMARSRDPRELLDLWSGWHAIARPMRNDFKRYVELGNKGARELGFADMGAMWRAKYDMPPDAFAQEVDRLWQQVRPLYQSLHAYVRTRLREKYGDAAVPEGGALPAHLLGNMWAQDWGNIYPLVAPPNADPGYDLTEILKSKKVDELEMVRYGERFFMSLGFEALPKSFWERSLFIKPRDRDVVCHASAWDIDNLEDLRIKMCIDITDEDFTTIHHELGHNFYQRVYNKLPMLFRDSANDGFHEALGDTIALSITPEYLVKLGFLKEAPNVSMDIGLLMRRALDKVAFLPFGLLIDQWRWKVFSNQIKPEDYNKTWWELRRKYQGVAPATARTEEDFDPGAKYHVAANVPYTRYFLATILQFQFHRALARAAGCKQPLHRCSIYGSKEAGQRLRRMMEMGMSRPWPEALKALTGQTRMDATAIRDYFAPLQKWLDEQNKGKPLGWQ
ncbi:MAG: M2 family metallopeptidase [Acidobacteria bacterium]|nr:M2 family metallopeptidase [Acidobacteriota bacterium]